MHHRPLKAFLLGAAITFAFGFALEEQRLEDRTPTYAIDREMDERVGAYVPLIRSGAIQEASRGDLRALAGEWRAARELGRIRIPMPVRYGDLDGPRAEIVHEALRVQCGVALEARNERDPSRARAALSLSMEPLLAVQYADISTLAKVAGRRKWLTTQFIRTGFSPTEAERATDALRPRREALDELFRHMARLRNRFRVRFESEDDAWNADPYFESIARGQSQTRRIARR